MGKKKCLRCGKTFPLTNEFFWYRNKEKKIFRENCKKCMKEMRKNWTKKTLTEEERGRKSSDARERYKKNRERSLYLARERYKKKKDLRV